MQKSTQHKRVFTIKSKNPSLKSADNLRRSTKLNVKVGTNYKKIPKLINEIQNNLQLLKKYYEQQIQNQQNSQPKFLTRVPSRAQSSNKRKIKQNLQHYQQQTITVPELDDLKKSFLTIHGYESNNIVQLYNFYKKNMEKSTRLFGSTSMSNMVNLTHNHSQLRQKCVRPCSGYLISNDQSKQKQQKQPIKYQQNYSSRPQTKLPIIQSQAIIKKTNEMVSVATLLADKKKISRKNICQNMNSENLLNQAKRKLYRPNPTENIQKFNRLKQNIKNQNYQKISPIKKARNDIKQKSNEKRSNLKEKQSQIRSKQRQSPRIRSHQQKAHYLKVPEIQNVVNSPQQQLKIPIILTQEAIIQNLSKKKQNSNTKEKQKQGKQLKEMKSAKSSRSIKSIKSPNSIRSPSLNQGIILDLTGSCEQSSRKNIQPSYFVPKIHNNLHDSLLDCQITPKQQSRILDLQSIPFDF